MQHSDGQYESGNKGDPRRGKEFDLEQRATCNTEQRQGERLRRPRVLRDHPIPEYLQELHHDPDRCLCSMCDIPKKE